MKEKTLALTLIFVVIGSIATGVYADSSREQLQQMVEQLQKNPSDTALREKIIRLAQDLKPAPAVPEEAERRMARGEAAFESAKDESGFENAILEFQASANAAPWYPNAYYNLGVAQEKANKPNEAMESFRFYLLAAPDGKDATEVKKRIYKLEYASEEVAKMAAVEKEKERKQREKEAVLERLKRNAVGYTNVYSCYTRCVQVLGEPEGVCKYDGCTWEEYHGRNWKGGTLSGGDSTRLEFPGDGTVTFWGLIGTPNGPSIYDIKWKCREGQDAWVELKDEGRGGITFSCDTSDPKRNPSVKYNYRWFY